VPSRRNIDSPSKHLKPRNTPRQNVFITKHGNQDSRRYSRANVAKGECNNTTSRQENTWAAQHA
jgi:hypothetical protein